MGLGDFISGQLAPRLARSQAGKLNAARETALKADPALPQKEYQRSREALLGPEFGPLPAGTACMPCAANAKAARRAERKNLTAAALEACPELTPENAQLRLDMDKVESARLAKHVYLKNDPDAPDDLKAVPPGFLAVSEEEMGELGVDKTMLEPKDTAFKSAIYKKDPLVWGEDVKPSYEIAFRGSTLAEEDWQNNFAQNANEESRYYQRAVRIGNVIADRGHANDVEMVGHSLGGGLASAAQGGAGSVAATFNAAGLHPDTVKRYSTIADRVQADADKIVAYHVDGEVVNATQEKGLLSLFANSAVGRPEVLAPASVGGTPDQLHAMDEVIESIEKRKASNEAKLKTCVASKKNANP